MTNNVSKEDAAARAARKEFFKIHGKEIQAADRAWEALITSPVDVDNSGFVKHPARLSQVEAQYTTQWVVQGYMPPNAVYFIPDETVSGNRFFIRIDHVLYSEDYLRPGKLYLHISRENGNWYARYDQVVWDRHLRIVDTRVQKYPAYTPIHLFMPTGRIRQDV